LRAYPAHNPDPLTLGLSSHNLAYVIYTSGSTGTPKGVMVEHRSVVNFWLELSRTTHSALPQRARIALNAAFSFDMSIKGLSQLLSGHCLVLVPQLIRASGAEMVHFLAHHRIDAFDSTPSQLEMLLTDGLLEHPDYVPRSVLLGGEPVSPSLWNRLRGCNSVRFYNMYGPTECTVDATIGLLQELGERPSIGRPIANTQVYLLDRQGQPVPIGVTGEIHIGGIGLARGYLGQPDLTAQRFIADPFGGTPHARLYKTGDLGRWLPDGTIEYLGRNDFQVKLRGFRIELGEIESQLRACPGVRDAVVIAREDQPGDKRLVAYLLAINDAPLAAAALRDQLATRLPDYMVPSAFVTLDAFPLTPNGKLDRHALPAPDANAIATREYAAPQGEIETTIAQIWQSLLGIERVGRHDDFFGLGGHSLLAVQMVSRLRQALGVEIALRELFVQTTLNKFSSAVLNHLRSELADSNLVAVRSHGNRPPIFLVHPIEGEIGYARELAACLDSERPVYALAATGLLKGEAPLASIPAMAARYVATIRKVQPQGPYHLAGWSAGGTIAYEMARQLIGADECVAFLGLIDTRADYRSANDEGTISASPSRMTEAEMLIDLASSLMSSQELVALQKLAAANRIEEMLRRCQEAGAIATDIDIDILRRHLGLRHATKNALLAYRPQALSVKVSLFTADEPARIDPLLGWASLPEVELRHVPIGGTHQSIVTHPHVKRLGAEVDQALLASPDVSNDTPELRYSPRITIQNGHRAAVPLFFVPGAGASVTTFFELTQALDLDIPIYGLQPRGLDGTLVPHIDVQSAARSYIKAVRDVAPDGQCHLVGHSYGGWIALDMGIRLKQAGVQVGALVLLDSDVPGSTLRQNIGDSEVDILICLIRHFEMSAQRSLNLRHQDLEGLSEAAQLELLLARLVDAKILPRQTRLQSLRGIVRVFRSNLNSHYAPSLPYTDDVHLVTATHDGATPPQNDEEPALVARWRSYAPKLEVWRSSGNHMTLLDTPHVKRLSDWLRQLVEKRPLPVSSMLK
ncbi:non-ribosomal peptide synthetase, partial [Burkholderia orbicola]